MIKLTYCFFALWLLGSIVAADYDINIKVKQLKDNMSPEEVKAFEDLIMFWSKIQNGELNFPIENLVLSQGLAMYVVKEKVVDVKKYQDGRANYKDFVKEFEKPRDFLWEIMENLRDLVKVKPEDEAHGTEETIKWIKSAKYLKEYFSGCVGREEEMFAIMNTLPLDLE